MLISSGRHLFFSLLPVSYSVLCVSSCCIRYFFFLASFGLYFIFFSDKSAPARARASFSVFIFDVLISLGGRVDNILNIYIIIYRYGSSVYIGMLLRASTPLTKDRGIRIGRETSRRQSMRWMCRFVLFAFDGIVGIFVDLYLFLWHIIFSLWVAVFTRKNGHTEKATCLIESSSRPRF